MEIKDQFISLGLTNRNLGNYYTRKSILEFINTNLKIIEGIEVDISYGFMPYRTLILSLLRKTSKYVGLDLVSNNYQKPDIEWDGDRMPIDDDSINTTLNTEVLEHCSDPEIISKEAYRILIQKECFYFTIPFLYPCAYVANDEYSFTPFSLGGDI